MLAGVNDSPAQARLLADTLGRDAFKVNLIPYNPTGSDYEGRPLLGSSRDAIAAFKAELDRAHVPSTVRLTRGRDIAAACGQLATAPRSRDRSLVTE
jgi:23S rRNA (adenine2503-C2)-methyltransferase